MLAYTNVPHCEAKENLMFEITTTTDLHSHPFQGHGLFDTIEESMDKGKELLKERQDPRILIGGKAGRYIYREVAIYDSGNPIRRMINACQIGTVANVTMTRKEDGSISVERDCSI
jgi:hypothetical protein